MNESSPATKVNEFSPATKEELETVEGGLNPQPLPPRVLNVLIFQAVKYFFG